MALQASSIQLMAPSGVEAPRAIFCKGLAKGASERCIAGLFIGFGTVVDCQIARHRSGRSAGFAIVTFSSHEEACAAIRGMDSVSYMGRPLSCRWYQQERDTADNLLIQPIKQAVTLGAHTPFQAQQQAQGQLPLPKQPPSHVLASSAACASPQHLPEHLQVRPPTRGGAPFDGSSGKARAPAPLSLEGWGSLPQVPGFASAGSAPAMATEEAPDGARRWSTMVNLWLQDYLNQDAPSAMDAHSSLSDPGLDINTLRRSFDGGATPASVERRRSTRDSLSRCLDSLNLAGGLASDHLLPYSLGGSTGGAAPTPGDSAFLAKSRLATKWTTDAAGSAGGAQAQPHTPQGSNGGGMGATATVAAAAGLLSAGGAPARSSDDFHVLADIKLLSSALSCPDGPSFLSSAWAPAGPASAGVLKFDALPSSAPHTAASSPPGKLAHQPRSYNWTDDIGSRRHVTDQRFKDGVSAASAGGAIGAGAHMLQRGPAGMSHQAQAQAQAQQVLQLHALQAQVAQQQQMVAMQAAQEQYVSALNQLTSAHSQVLAAAAALQDAGMLPPVSNSLAPAPPMASFGAKVQPAPPSCQPPSYGGFSHPNNGFMMLRGQGAAQSIF